MTRGEALKDSCIKSILPVAVAMLLFCIFKSACTKDEITDYVWLWILCGLPFGLHWMSLWIVPGRLFLRGRDRAVRSEFHPWRSDRRFRSGMETFGGRVLCADHRIPPDREIRDFASWKCGKLPAYADGKTHSQPMEKDDPFPQVCKQVSHSNAGSGSLHTVPQRLLL